MIDEKVLIERLEEEKQRLRKLKNNTIALSDSEVCAIEEGAYNFCKAIVNQLAEEHNSSTVNSTIKEKFVAELERTLNKCNGDYMCIGTDIQKYLLEVLKKGHNNGWIACSEKLPEENEYVLAFVPNNSTRKIIITPYHDIYCWKNGTITHWQPLPAPYQPKGEQP